jgi:hypothetical protein
MRRRKGKKIESLKERRIRVRNRINQILHLKKMKIKRTLQNSKYPRKMCLKLFKNKMRMRKATNSMMMMKKNNRSNVRKE